MPQTIQHGTADVVRRFLVALGLGTLPSANGAWPIFASEEPDAPDNCITCYGTTGSEDGAEFPQGRVVRHRGCQVRIRAGTSPVGEAKADEAMTVMETALHSYLTVDGIEYYLQCFTDISEPLPLGKEGPTNRMVWTINAKAALKVAP